MNKGFNRLRLKGLKGAAASCVLGLGALGGGSVRAITTATALNLSRSSVVTGSHTVTGNWPLVHGLLNTSGWSGVATSMGFDVAKTALSEPYKAAGLGNANLGALGNAFDRAMILGFAEGYLFGNPRGGADLSTTVVDGADGSITVTTETLATTRAGLLTSIEYYMPADSMIMRISYIMQSDFKSDQNVRAVIGGKLGSRADTTLQGTSSGNEMLEDSDLWFVTNDNPATGGASIATPTVLVSRHGTDSPVTPINQYSPGSGLDLFLSAYDFTVPVDQTSRIVVFVSLHETVDAAKAQGAWYESTLQAAKFGLADPTTANADLAGSTGLMSGLTATEIATIVNYPADSEGDLVPDSTDNCPATLNTNQDNFDGDSAGDACDAFPEDPMETMDTDLDGVGDNGDNCPLVSNTDQRDTDNNGKGDACDEPPKKGGSLGLPTLAALLLGGLLPRVRRSMNTSGSK